MGLSNEDWDTIRVLLKAWGYPQYDDETDAAYRMVLGDLDAQHVGMAIKYLSEKGDHYRPSAPEIRKAASGLVQSPAPDWTRARRLCVKAVNKQPSNYYELSREGEKGKKRIRSWQLAMLRDEHPIVADWLHEYGIERFATEGSGEDPQWVDKRQRESYEKFLAHGTEIDAAQRTLSPGNGGTSPTSLPRRIDPARGLPAASNTVGGDAA